MRLLALRFLGIALFLTSPLPSAHGMVGSVNFQTAITYAEVIVIGTVTRVFRVERDAHGSAIRGVLRRSGLPGHHRGREVRG